LTAFEILRWPGGTQAVAGDHNLHLAELAVSPALLKKGDNTVKRNPVLVILLSVVLALLGGIPACAAEPAGPSEARGAGQQSLAEVSKQLNNPV
jgi:hypothetical protein